MFGYDPSILRYSDQAATMKSYREIRDGKPVRWDSTCKTVVEGLLCASFWDPLGLSAEHQKRQGSSDDRHRPIYGNENYGTQLGDGFGNCWHEMFSCSTNRQVASVRFAKGILRFRRNKIKVPHARGYNPEIGPQNQFDNLHVNPRGHTWPIVKCVNGEKHWFNIV